MINNSVCRNPWCKSHFTYKEDEMINQDGDMLPPRECSKCRSFNNELSGGVEWKDKEYEGSRFDGMPHQFKYKITNFK
jgi:hypothetical protein